MYCVSKNRFRVELCGHGCPLRLDYVLVIGDYGRLFSFIWDHKMLKCPQSNTT